MQTSLPHLPLHLAEINLSLPRSSAYTGSGAHPRTDLKTLQPWMSFTTEIHDVILAKMVERNIPSGTELQVGSPRRRRKVNCEEKLRAHADVALHEAVQDVVEQLGIEGSFELPSSGNIAIVGEPDFSWITSDTSLHAKLVIEYKTDWVADLRDLPTFFAVTGQRTKNERQSIEALEQLYGYMTFNCNKFGILTNWTRAWFLRRVETDTRKTLEYAGPIELAGSPGMPSMLKAFVGMVLLAEKDWFYTSPTPDSPPPARFFGHSTAGMIKQKTAIAVAGNYNVAPNHGSYPLLTLDFRLCDFELSTRRRSRLGSVVRTQLFQDALDKPPLVVMCKVVDAIHSPDASIALEHESRMYASLQSLQGAVIPKLYGYYEVWGMLRILALQPVGEAISEDRVISNTLRNKMKAVLGRIHAAGYIHGDIARRNFCEEGDQIFIIDLERTRQTQGDWERAEEMRLIDDL